ncbi:helix-turn-helix domain-containing protein [Arthrobacter sp. ov118]|uniref:helix-turn-helix domain-containing protein n=1 Tax=Arthrobacter sp. ov118 TaxID=1761747 RepID=UPI0008E19240|nr:helix-turn-helix domain-containing protein [Arthrobacter sp. ov118]SFT92883.1 DNA binding domain-containing protein, excisionase family [Arthrobacter sp. ov118]
MPKQTEDGKENPAPTTGPVFPRMLTLEQVQKVLNAKGSLVYSLVRSGELPAGQFGGRGVWRVRESDLTAYIDAAFAGRGAAKAKKTRAGAAVGAERAKSGPAR